MTAQLVLVIGRGDLSPATERHVELAKRLCLSNVDVEYYTEDERAADPQDGRSIEPPLSRRHRVLLGQTLWQLPTF